MNNQLSIPEETLRKQERLSELRTELAKHYEEREEMLSFIKPTLIAKYTELIGRLQFDEYVLQVEIMRYKRKSQLMQTSINRGEPIDSSYIEQQLQKEFAEYQRKIGEQEEAIKSVEEYLSSPALSDEEAAELKNIYNVLVKRLHPDCNPNQTEDEIELFICAQAAYKTCNLQELRNILLHLNAGKKTIEHKEKNIDNEIARYEKSLADIIAKIEALKQSFPFTYADKLADEVWVKAEQDRLRHSIAQLEKDRQKWSLYVVSLSTIIVGEA